MIRHLSIYHIGLFALGVWVIYILSLNPLSWDAPVAVGLFVIAVLPGVFRFVGTRIRSRTLFRVNYEPHPNVTNGVLNVQTSGDMQDCGITLELTLNTHVTFASLKFEGEGLAPEIVNLWDWQRDKYQTQVGVYVDGPLRNGTMYWGFHEPSLRQRKSRITIGIEYKAPKMFRGDIVLGVRSSHGDKTHRLPFTALLDASS